MTCELRYFFDPGSGTCLWAGNDAARAAHGYAVKHADLPLSDAAKRALDDLIARFDRSIDWQSPTESRWTAQESAGFFDDARQVLERLRAELDGSQYTVRD